MKIDWDNLKVKEYTALELIKIKALSYERYGSVNGDMIWLILAILMIGFSSMLYAMNKQFYIFNVGEFPVYHKEVFWIIEYCLFFGGLALLPLWWKFYKKTIKRYREMENIRKMINEELKIR